MVFFFHNIMLAVVIHLYLLNIYRLPSAQLTVASSPLTFNTTSRRSCGTAVDSYSQKHIFTITGGIIFNGNVKICGC